MTRKQQILTECAVTSVSRALSREGLVNPLHVFGRCSSGMVTVERRTGECGHDLRQQLLNRKRLVKESIRFDHDALCCQTAECMARHEEDAEYFFERQRLLDQLMAVDAGVLICGRGQLKVGGR